MINLTDPTTWASSPRPWRQDPDAPWRVLDAAGALVTEFTVVEDPGRGSLEENWGNAHIVVQAVNGTPVLQAMNSEHDMTTQQLAVAVHSWAEATFPHRDDTSMLLKLYSEIGELVNAPGHPDELADLFILLLDFAVRHKLDVKKIVMKKLYTNMNRKWTKNHLTGVYSHVKD